MKLTKQLGLFVFGVITLVCTSCMRNDDEPALPERPISRLYVSMSEFRIDDTQDPYTNLLVVDPADSATMESSSPYYTEARGGSAIYFEPAISSVFQANLTDTNLFVLSVSNRGVLSVSGVFGHEALDAMRGIWYHHPSENLYVANLTNPSTLYVYHQPLRKRGHEPPKHALQLGDVRPWGICMYDDNMLMVRTGAGGGVSVYTDLPADTNSTSITAAATLTVDGASDLRGVAYSKSLDLMVLSDHSGNRVYLFEQASALFSSSGTITPTRIISGSNTGLNGPIDVTIDDRSGGERLYVANAQSKTVSRFPIAASGNATPETTLSLFYAPASVYVDARGRAMDDDVSTD